MKQLLRENKLLKCENRTLRIKLKPVNQFNRILKRRQQVSLQQMQDLVYWYEKATGRSMTPIQLVIDRNTDPMPPEVFKDEIQTPLQQQ